MTAKSAANFPRTLSSNSQCLHTLPNIFRRISGVSEEWREAKLFKMFPSDSSITVTARGNINAGVIDSVISQLDTIPPASFLPSHSARVRRSWLRLHVLPECSSLIKIQLIPRHLEKCRMIAKKRMENFQGSKISSCKWFTSFWCALETYLERFSVYWNFMFDQTSFSIPSRASDVTQGEPELPKFNWMFRSIHYSSFLVFYSNIFPKLTLNTGKKTFPFRFYRVCFQ